MDESFQITLKKDEKNPESKNSRDTEYEEMHSVGYAHNPNQEKQETLYDL